MKESGAIEEGGDIVMLLHRGKESGRDELSNVGALIVAKHKYGQEGYIDLLFDGSHQIFREAAK
jgi:replicative DNA helicase